MYLNIKVQLQHYPRLACIMNQLFLNKLQTMLLTAFECSFLFDLIVEESSKIHNLKSKVEDKYKVCLINIVKIMHWCSSLNAVFLS